MCCDELYVLICIRICKYSYVYANIDLQILSSSYNGISLNLNRWVFIGETRLFWNYIHVYISWDESKSNCILTETTYFFPSTFQIPIWVRIGKKLVSPNEGILCMCLLLFVICRSVYRRENENVREKKSCLTSMC